MTIDQHAEYAVEVQDIGFVTGATHAPYYVTVGAGDPDVFDDEEEVRRCAQKIADDYRRLGQPDMAAKVVIHVRAVTTTREEWAAIGTAIATP
jgi:hypothetical protein